MPVTSWRNWRWPASTGRVGSLRWVTWRRAGDLHAKKITRNPSNHESWWWPTARFGPRRPAHIEVRRDAAASFVPLPFGYRCSAIMRFLVSLRDRDPKKSREIPRCDARGESAIEAAPWSSQCKRVLAFAFQSRVDRKIVAVLFHLRNRRGKTKREVKLYRSLIAKWKTMC